MYLHNIFFYTVNIRYRYTYEYKLCAGYPKEKFISNKSIYMDPYETICTLSSCIELTIHIDEHQHNRFDIINWIIDAVWCGNYSH